MSTGRLRTHGIGRAIAHHEAQQAACYLRRKSHFGKKAMCSLWLLWRLLPPTVRPAYLPFAPIPASLAHDRISRPADL